MRFPRCDGTPCQDPLRRALGPYEIGEGGYRDRREAADVDLGQAEPGALLADDEIAACGQLEASPQADTAHGGDADAVAACQGAEDRVKAAQHPLDPLGGVVLDIHSGRESAISGSGQDDEVGLVLREDGRESFSQLQDGGDVENVERRPVEEDPGDAAGPLETNSCGFRRHPPDLAWCNQRCLTMSRPDSWPRGSFATKRSGRADRTEQRTLARAARSEE